MVAQKQTGAEIRQGFIDFFVKRGHTFVPSSSLVPGGDQTLLFTNAGMVQFKEVFLGTERRAYTRAANSQKCMRVAGKHNDLEDVGRDNTHHTFFEMLGNWSFGDYYKNEAIAWAWELLTEVWGLPRERLWATCFLDEKGEIPTDEEAAVAWQRQPGMDTSHILFFGRKENFWEMAETGPCGPCSEIHLDRGEKYCDKKGIVGHVCKVNGDCQRFLELWNLVFIQYNRKDETHLEPLPAKHVDTGMGLERIVSVLQDTDSNYKTDLFLPILEKTRALTGHSLSEMEENFTPYRVIADHGRAATFLIADGVVPGNIGRNYVCRMIIRRASRFGAKIGLTEPFLAQIADVVIKHYGEFYPELKRNKSSILINLTNEEKRFQRTVESGVAKLESMLHQLKRSGKSTLPGEQAFDLYATYGLPFEITRDIAQEESLDVDESGFRLALEEHRLASGAGEAFGALGGEDAAIYQKTFDRLREEGKLEDEGVEYNPYEWLKISTTVLALFKDGQPIEQAMSGDTVEVLLPRTGFYIESGGQVSDTGKIFSAAYPYWEICIEEMRKPAAGMIVHIGKVTQGAPHVGDAVIAQVDADRRADIMRNHTATHLLHAALRRVLGEHARQAGSLVAPDRLRFDFTHPQALTPEELERIESDVNEAILKNYHLNIAFKPLQQAIQEGAIALFGEKYEEYVRNITIGEEELISNELCGGTHVHETGDIGIFLITSEGSAAAGIRRIEAVTGRGAYQLIRKRFREIKEAARLLDATPDNLSSRLAEFIEEWQREQKLNIQLRKLLAQNEFQRALENMSMVSGVPVLCVKLPHVDIEAMREIADNFRQRIKSGVAVLASLNDQNKPLLIATVTDDLVKRGLRADELVKHIAQPLGGSGGGRPSLAQAGGKDATKLEEALERVFDWVAKKLDNS